MSNKKCMVFETLNKVSNLTASKCNDGKEMRLQGVFGVCGVRNQNNRVYDKDNYNAMVESLQKVISTEGCPGELEHPNTMNINLENVSHKIESIEMNEDGTITGTILLLNTPKGKIAQAIVEGGLPLYISSRGSGTITNEGKVTLSTIKTYDLVGTPGFSQAKLTLKENQMVECLNENANDGNISWVIYENDEESKDEDKPKSKKDKDTKSKDEEPKDEEPKDEEPKDDESEDDPKDEEPKDDEPEDEEPEDKQKKDKSSKKDENNKDIDKVTMKDLKEAIDKITEKITSLEAELHVAKESLNTSINYDGIQKWIQEEFAPEFKSEIIDDVNESIDESIKENNVNIANGVEKWVSEEFAPTVQNWICEEFAPEVQNWICEEFAPEVQNWVVEEFAPEVQNWIVEEYSPVVEGWVCNEFAPVVEGWVTDEFAPVVESWITNEYSPVVEGWITNEFGESIKEEMNSNVSMYLESQKAERLSNIDNLLESLSSNTSDVEQIVKEQNEENKYQGIYVVEHMPAQYGPSWSMISEAKQQEIIRNSKLYDFTKAGAVEKFWSNVDFKESKEEPKKNDNVFESYHNAIASEMLKLRKA